MRANAATNSLPRRRASKTSIATLTALFALAAGAQALLPAQAAAEIAEGNGSTCTLKDEVPTDGNGQLCTIGEEVIPVRDTPDSCAGRSLCLPAMNGVPIPTGGDGSSGERPGPGQRGGVVTKAPKVENPVVCARLRVAYQLKRPLSVNDAGEVRYFDFVPMERDDFLTRIPTPSMLSMLSSRHRLNRDERRLEELDNPVTVDVREKRRQYQKWIDEDKRELAREFQHLKIWNGAWDTYGCVGIPPWLIWPILKY